MKAFVVELENRSGAMARITERLAARGVNILVFGLSVDEFGVIGFVTSDEPAAQTVLRETGAQYHEHQVLHVRMEDTPGQAASVSSRLAEAGVNILAWLPVDTTRESFTVAIAVDNVDVARQALAECAVSFTYA